MDDGRCMMDGGIFMADERFMDRRTSWTMVAGACAPSVYDERGGGPRHDRADRVYLPSIFILCFLYMFRNDIHDSSITYFSHRIKLGIDAQNIRNNQAPVGAPSGQLPPNMGVWA